MLKPAVDNGTKDRIRTAAAELFARDGYHATGVAALSEAVQLGRGALYYHIGNKEAVLFEICRLGVGELIPEAQVVVDSTDDPAVKFRSLARKLMRNIASNRAAWTVFFREFHALTGERLVEIRASRRTYERQWNEVLVQGVASGAFSSARVTPLMVKGILGMFNYSYLWFDMQGPSSPEDIADQFADATLGGISRRPNLGVARLG